MQNPKFVIDKRKAQFFPKRSCAFLPFTPVSASWLRKEKKRQLIVPYSRNEATMCLSSATHAFLKALPKCEHHMHLEGSLSPTLLFELARKNGVQLPTDKPEYESPATLEARYSCFENLQDFLNLYYLGMSVLRTQNDFEDLAWAYFLRVSEENVHHAEVFYDPQAHLERGIDLDSVTSGIASACKRAQSELGISTRIIMCFLRHLPAVQASDTLQLAKNYFHDGTLAGVGLDSAEVGNRPEFFEKAFHMAKELGIRRTAHAGEEGDASYISSALDSLDVERIDHGIRLAEDVQLIRRIADAGILLTICPLSNVRLRCVSSVSELPLRLFLSNGVAFSINSDDPAYFGGFILQNYCTVQEHFHFTAQEWETICRASIEKSWIDDKRKRELLHKLNLVLKHYANVKI